MKWFGIRSLEIRDETSRLGFWGKSRSWNKLWCKCLCKVLGVHGFGVQILGIDFRLKRYRGQGFRVWGLVVSGFVILSSGFRVSGFGFRITGFGSGSQVPGSGVRAPSSGFRVSEIRVPGSGFRVPGFEFQDPGSGIRDPIWKFLKFIDWIR